MARATVTLYQALEAPTIHERVERVKAAITMNPSNKVCDEVEMRVQGVDMGKHLLPNSAIQYHQLALRGLGVLTDSYLGSEFQLYWTEERLTTYEITLGWKVQSLVGALYLKLGYLLRRSRCQVCGMSIGHARQGAKTCSNACRQRLSRSNRKRQS